MAKTASKKSSQVVAEPPAWHLLPMLHAGDDIRQWLEHYWAKLGLPNNELGRLAITQDRREFARWTGRRLNPLALGCYCYLPGSHEDATQTTRAQAVSDMQAPAFDHAMGLQLSLPGFEPASSIGPTKTVIDMRRHRHLIFVEPDLLPLGREVTVAHELIHLADRVRGRPRKHHCHGYDSIAADEAAITGYDPDLLRQLLRDESTRREAVLRQARPVRYLYYCQHCGKEYPRVRRYPRPVSCGSCDRAYNPNYLLVLRSEQAADQVDDDIALDAEIMV